MASKAEIQQAREKARDDSRKPVPGIIKEICVGGRYQPPSDPEAKVAPTKRSGGARPARRLAPASPRPQSAPRGSLSALIILISSEARYFTSTPHWVSEFSTTSTRLGKSR